MRKMFLLLVILHTMSTAEAQSFKKFGFGRYYDLDNQKHIGYIYHAIPASGMFKGKGDHIIFRAGKESKNQSIESSAINSFVIETDSFTVSRDTTLLRKRPFLRVMLDQPIKIYLSEAQAGSYVPLGIGVAGIVGGAIAGAAAGMVTLPIIYLYGKSPENMGVITNKNFMQVMCTIMADKPLITDKIKDKYFRLNDMPELIEAYKTGVIKERPKYNNTYDGYN